MIQRAARFAKDYSYWKLRRLLRPQSITRRVALASFPRSGNTWMRMLIESATGQEAGSRYQDRVFPRGPDGIVIKTHARDRHRYGRALFLIRHPLNAFESYYFWKNEIGGASYVEKKPHLRECVRGWKNLITHWESASYPVHIIRFEDLRSDPVEQLGQALQFLDHPVDTVKVGQAIEECRLSQLRQNAKSVGDKFFRKGQVAGNNDFFDDSDREFAKQQLADELLRFDYTI